MVVEAGSFSPGQTVVSISGLTFLPNELQFRMGNATAADDTGSLARCDSWTTANNQSYDTWYRDGNGSKQSRGTDKCIRYFRRVSGTITDITVATFVSFDNNGGGDYGFTLNFSTYDPSYQIRYIARG